MIKIKHPYANTPYDLLSDPNDPEIGLLTPDSPHKAINIQRTKVFKAYARERKDIHDVADAANILSALPKRLSYDVFLRSTLNRMADLDELAKYTCTPAPAAAGNTDWLEGLDFSMELTAPVELQEIQLSHLSNFDDVKASLLNVDFDR